MKWVRRIVMFLLIVAIAGSGFMAFKKYQPWSDAKSEYNEINDEEFVGKDADKGFTTAENQQSVAWIACIDANGSGSIGTCYAVGNIGDEPEYFVTNGHVVQLAAENGNRILVFLDDGDYLEAELVYFELDENLDMAIVKLPYAVDVRTPVVFRDSSEVIQGENCMAIGYPGKSLDLDKDFDGSISGQSVNKGVISKTNVTPPGCNFKTFQHDAWVSNGNSGGPLFDGTGFLIGMNTMVHKESENVNIAIESEEIMNMLDKQGIDYATTDDYKKDIKKVNASAEKKFDKKHEAALDEASDNLKKAETKFFIYAGVAVACLIALVIVFVIGNKKVVVVGEQDDGKKNYLICVQGIFQGQSFEITGHTMTIGRDQHSCTFVFPEDTPGISSNHCSIYYDARTKAFILTDNGSTYGTYLSDGRKLTKGVPETLLPGSTFALADKTNVFKVDRV